MAPELARASECQTAPGNNVLCPKPSFDLLIDGLVKSRADLKVCRLEGESLQDELNLANGKVAELSAKLPCPVCVKPAPPSPDRFIGGYALGVLGAVSVAAALGFPLPDPVRLGLGLGGVAGIGVGMVLVIP